MKKRILTPEQKEAGRIRASIWYKENKDRAKANAIARYIKNKESILGKLREKKEADPDFYKKEYARNRTKKLDAVKRHYQKNKEKITEKTRARNKLRQAQIKQYYKDNKQRIIAKTMESRNARLCEWKAYVKEWKAKNKDKVRIQRENRRARIGSEKISPGIVKKLMVLQRGKCVVCKTAIADEYHIDHKTPIALGGLNNDANIQLLCPTCNLSKGAKPPVEFMQSRGFLL